MLVLPTTSSASLLLDCGGGFVVGISHRFFVADVSAVLELSLATDAVESNFLASMVINRNNLILSLLAAPNPCQYTSMSSPITLTDDGPCCCNGCLYHTQSCRNHVEKERANRLSEGPQSRKEPNTWILYQSSRKTEGSTYPMSHTTFQYINTQEK